MPAGCFCFPWHEVLKKGPFVILSVLAEVAGGGAAREQRCDHLISEPLLAPPAQLLKIFLRMPVACILYVVQVFKKAPNSWLKISKALINFTSKRMFMMLKISASLESIFLPVPTGAAGWDRLYIHFKDCSSCRTQSQVAPPQSQKYFSV